LEKRMFLLFAKTKVLQFSLKKLQKNFFRLFKGQLFTIKKIKFARSFFRAKIHWI
jgi:hypothetical protein